LVIYRAHGFIGSTKVTRKEKGNKKGINQV